LRALGRSYAELGKKKLTLDTFRRLVEFDPRNFENHHLLAQASLKFHETDLAEKQLVEILTIQPTHMPSVRTQLKNHFDKSSYAAVVAAYEHYLNAFLIQTITVALGQSSVQVNVPVDGRYHDVDLRLMQSPGGAAELALQVGEYAIDIERVTLQAPLVVGQTGVAITPIWPSQTSWQVQEMERVGEGSFRALGRGASLRLKVPAQPQEIAAVHLRLRLFKSIDSDMWKMVALSYQRLLRYDDLKTAQARSVIGSPK
jgi:hypothetical protein